MGKKCEFKSTSFHTLHPCHLLPISTEILGNFQLDIVNVEELFNWHTDFVSERDYDDGDLFLHDDDDGDDDYLAHDDDDDDDDDGDDLVHDDDDQV